MTFEQTSRANLRRRAVTVPVVLLAAALVWVTLPLSLAIVALWDLVRGDMRTFPRTRAVIFFSVYLMTEVLGLIVAFALMVATAGGRIGGSTRYEAMNLALQRVWTDALYHGSRRIFSMRVQATGLDEAARGPYLLFIRHCSSADVVLAAGLIANPLKLKLRYVLKRELLADPCLDIVGQRLNNAFVDRAAADNRDELGAVAQLTRDLDDRSAVLIYPEGTRFLKHKLVRSIQKLRELGHHELADQASGWSNVLPPRLGGALTLLKAAPELDVVFVEHAGLDGVETFADFWGGGLVGKTIHVRARRFKAADIPTENQAMWLFERWTEVDQFVGQALALPSPVQPAAALTHPAAHSSDSCFPTPGL